MAKQRFRGGSRNRYGSVPAYDYGPGGGIDTDFGAIASEVASDYEKRIEVAKEAREELQGYQKEATESQDYPHTGVASIDQSTMNIAEQAKEGILAARNKIGTVDPVTKKMYTISDFARFKNNLINGSKIWAGQAKLVESTMDTYSKNKNLSDITTEAFTKGVGATQDKDKSYDVKIDENGNFMLKTKDENNKETLTNFKQTAINGVQEINRFNSTEDISEFQKVYANKKKTFDIGGQMYQAEEVMKNPVLFTQHITEQSDEFGAAKKAYIDNFMNDDQKVISYAYDNMGVKLGELKSDGTLVDENTIAVGPNGQFVVGSTVRENAKTRFSQEVDGAFGVKKEGKAQRLGFAPAPSPSGKREDTGIFKKDLKQTYSTATQPDVRTYTDKEGFKRTTTVKHGIQDINRMVALGKSMMSEDPIANAAELIDKGVGLDGQEFDLNSSEYKAWKGNFDANNPDLVMVNDSGQTVERGVGITSLDDVRAGNIDIEGFSLGLDMTAADLEEMGLTSAVSTAMTSINGASFVYERRPKENATYGKVGEDQNINDITDVVPIGLRFTGNTEISSMKRETSVEPNLQGTTTETALTGSSKKTKQTQVMTNKIEDGRIPGYIKIMSKKSPNLQRAFNAALKNARSNTEAFYIAMQSVSK